MPYLTGRLKNRFENNMKVYGVTPSKQLFSTVTAVKTYLVEPAAGRIRDVKFCWEAWRTQQATEFRQKGADIQVAFERELVVEYRMRRIKIDPDPAPPPQVADSSGCSHEVNNELWSRE